jgi:phage shock protein C
MNLKGLRRIPERGVIAGVCAGIAEYFDWNTKLLRIGTVLLFVFGGGFPVIVVYCVLWYVMDPLTPAEAAATITTPGGVPAPGRAPSSMDEIKARFAKLDDRLRGIEECVTEKEFELRRELKKLEA